MEAGGSVRMGRGTGGDSSVQAGYARATGAVRHGVAESADFAARGDVFAMIFLKIENMCQLFFILCHLHLN
ncbi:hypothetical protein DK842_01810 [Chromobacterium phragmitis]|nr:hypothetical protein DK842_01810 [Chromobacterium phragmitis]